MKLSIFFILQGDFGIVNRLLGGFIGIQNDVRINAVENGELGNARAHGEDGMLGFARFRKKANIGCLHDRGCAVIRYADGGCAAGLGKLQGFDDIL